MKKIKLDLAQLANNPTLLLSAFRHQAGREWWTPEQIQAVINEASNGDKAHLVLVLAAHCEEPKEGDKEW